jgi:hypothetical protein
MVDFSISLMNMTVLFILFWKQYGGRKNKE